MTRSLLLAVALGLLMPPPAVDAVESPARYLVPRGDELPPGAVIVHDYGTTRLVESAATTPVSSRWRRLPAAATLAFGPWTGPRPDTTAPDADARLWALALVGPLDRDWRHALAALGLEVVGRAAPFGLVVRGDASAVTAAAGLRTSAGRPVVEGAAPLPTVARLDPALAAGARWPTDVADTVRVVRWRGGPTPPDVRTLASATPEKALADPDIAWIGRALHARPHANLALQDRVLAVEPVRDDLDVDGAGVIVAHHDSGVDLGHPALPHDAIVATRGHMLWTDTGHGTHTAALIAGRGSGAAPAEGGGCAPLFEPRGTILGAAPGARLAVNNLFDGGLDAVSDQMVWSATVGASISSNSWGEVGTAGDATGYTASSAAVDAAVRDADPDAPGAQPLVVVFSAGNTGPEPGTVTSPGTAKNAITVGATQNARCGSWVPGREAGPDPTTVISSSARGPSQGRLKPDLVATGADVLSAASSDPFATRPWDEPWTGPSVDLATGTSQAAAVTAGAAAVLVQWLRETTGRDPSPAMVKAHLVNGAVPIDADWPSHTQGWGRLDLRRAVAGPPGGAVVAFDVDETPVLATAESWHRTLEVGPAADELEITLVWSDPPAEPGSQHPLVNDLDLVVTAPDGTGYRGNRLAGGFSMTDPGADADDVNPVEAVRVAGPVPGTWTLDVTAVDVPIPPPGLEGQDFVVVAAGDVARCAAPQAPASLSATPVGPNAVHLEWAAVAGADAYRVERSRRPDGRPWTTVAEVDAPSTTFVDTDVSGGVTTWWRVSAVAECAGPGSPSATAVPDGACRLAPAFAGLAHAGSTARQRCAVDLTWPAAASPCGETIVYDVYADASPDVSADPELRVASGVDTLAWRDDTLEPGAERWYLVRARGVGSGLDDGNEVRLSATVSGPEAVWLADDGAASTHPWVVPAASTADAGTRSWRRVDDPLPDGGPVWFCADDDRHVDRAVAMAADLELPDTPSATLTFRHRWALEERFDGGVLEYSTDSGRTWHDILAGDGDRVPADDGRLRVGGYLDTITALAASPLAGRPAWTGLTREWHAVEVDLADFAGQRLRLRWRLVCDDREAVGGGWWIDDLEVAHTAPCTACEAPAPPASVTARAGADAVRVEWSPVTGAAAYRVDRADAGAPFLEVARLASPVIDWADGSVSGGRTAQWRVRSEGADGCVSEPSAAAEATAVGPCRLPPVFAGATAAVDLADPTCRVELRWPAAEPRCPTADLRYRVYRGDHATFAPDATTLVADGLRGIRWVDGGPTADEPSWWIVRALDLASGLEDANLRRVEAVPRGPTVVALEVTADGEDGGVSDAPGSPADPGSEPWRRDDTDAASPPASWWCPAEPRVKDRALVTTEPIVLPADRPVELRFSQRVDLEPFYDGGVLEYSTDGGGTWHDILAGDGGDVPPNPDRIIVGAYDTTLAGGANPLAGRRAWTGSPEPWFDVRVDLSDLTSHDILLRWRLGCDASRARTGWRVDDVVLSWPSRCEDPGIALGPASRRVSPGS